MTREKMVSTAILHERRQRLREEIEEQRRIRSDADPFFRITEWVLAEWENAEKEAAREYVPTAEAARLTGWSRQTLLKYAARSANGEAMLPGWEEMRCRRSGSEWTFCVSTIPVKDTRAA